jgi:dienelactone hydrolase
VSVLRQWGWETAAFRAATAVALLHALDDAFLNRQPGVDLDQHALAAAISLAGGGAAIIGFPRLRPGFRAAIALVFGVLAATNGALHVIHIAKDGPAHSDLSGVLATLAGTVLIGLALWIPWRHRGEGARTARRRWINRVIAIVVGALVVYAGLYPTAIAIVPTHKYREPIPATPRGYQAVTFDSSDGLRLSGWYAPSRNGAAIVLVHGGGGDRTGPVDHAALLRRHGYGVLLYDSRGRGESEGTPNAWGWGWEKDVDGALAFLAARDDVDDDRIGGLGLSTGADVLIHVAPEHRELRAVVSDGATAASFDDQIATFGFNAAAPYFWTLLTAGRVFSGYAPGPPLEERVAEISPTPLLLIAAGGFATEIDFNRHYAEVAEEPFEYWELPAVGHTAAVRERADEYEERVVGFFDAALLEDGTS